MLFLYNTGIRLYHLFIKIAAVVGNEKARKWLQGRKDWRLKLEQFVMNDRKKKVWFHCASLGEFEQGRPVIEELKKQYPDLAVVLTFFSPSGYEIRKGYDGADLVLYLPIDNRRNAEDFIELLQPQAVFFVKYEYWFHFLNTLSNRKTPLFFLSCNFREDHIFFKSYGGFFRKMLASITLLMVQNERSAKLLNASGFRNFRITGDTRFDRVSQIAKSPVEIPAVRSFKKEEKLIVGGSTWPDDEKLLLEAFVTLSSSSKLILVPHDIEESKITALMMTAKEKFGNNAVCRFSSADPNARIMIVDTIGFLSSIYRHADIAWIGGGFGAGIHNTLEAAAYGIPILFGPNHHKFNEANELINCGAAFEIKDKKEAKTKLAQLLNDDKQRMRSGQEAKTYVSKNTGATNRIMELIKPYLPY